MSDPVIRRATSEDSEALGSVHVRTWQVAYRGQFPGAWLDALDPTARAKVWREAIAQGSMTLFVSEANGKVVGFCGIRPATDPDLAGLAAGEFTSLFVDADHWGGGHGSALVAAARQAAGAQGWTLLVLWVLVSNTKARAFYERHGYSADGSERTTDRRGFPLHQVRYRLSLALPAP